MWEPFFTYDEFKRKILSDLIKQNDTAKIIGDYISIIANRTEFKIFIKDFYKEYEWTQSYDLVLNNVIDHLQDEIADCHQELDFGRVFPCLRKRGEDNHFLSEPYEMDLEIYYAQDMGEFLQFVDINEHYDFDKLKNTAIKNLESIPYKWVQIDPDHSLWSFETMTDYSSTLFTLPSVRKSLEKHLGDEFYIVFSSATSVLAGACSSLNYDLLKRLVEYDPDFNKISNEIYLYKNGHLSYTNPKSRFKVIKGGELSPPFLGDITV